MKINSLATRAKNTALFGFIMTLAACQSDEQKIANLDDEIIRLETQIDSIKNHNQIIDSAAHNPMLQILNQWIDEDTKRIETLRERNWIMQDSIANIQIQRIAQKYPLTRFLSPADLKKIQTQLRRGHSGTNEKAATRIIGGRGTLFDLYCVSFDLSPAGMPFQIIDITGTVRFKDKKLNALCKKFDDEKFAAQNANKTNKQMDANRKEIEEFDRNCAIRDSIYAEIESRFAPRIEHDIDSLRNAKKHLMMEKSRLIKSMNARNR